MGVEKDSHIDLGIDMASYTLTSDLIVDAIGNLDKVIGKYIVFDSATEFMIRKSADYLKPFEKKTE